MNQNTGIFRMTAKACPDIEMPVIDLPLYLKCHNIYKPGNESHTHTHTSFALISVGPGRGRYSLVDICIPGALA